MEAAEPKEKPTLERIDPSQLRLLAVLASDNCEVRRGIYKDRQVVVKILKSEDSFMRSAMVCEAEIWSSLNRHPNVVRFLGMSKSLLSMNSPFRECFLVSEYMDFGTLDSYMKHHNSMGSQEMLRLLIEAAKGLEYVHLNGIVHRDVKLDNFLVNGSLEVKIIDFGFSERLSERVGGLVYTPVYVAPEVKHGVYGPYSDVYSFGVCLGKAEKLVKGKHWASKEMQSHYRALKDRCIDKNSAKRPTMSQVLQSLISIKDDYGKSSKEKMKSPQGHGVFLRRLGCFEFNCIESVSSISPTKKSNRYL